MLPSLIGADSLNGLVKQWIIQWRLMGCCGAIKKWRLAAFNSIVHNFGVLVLVEAEFGTGTIDVDKVNITRKKAWIFHRKNDAMAPDGDIYFHPDGNAYMDDFSTGDLSTQGFFLHEMTHVYEVQTTGKTLWSIKGAFNTYKVIPSDIINGKQWESFNIEQQAQIVRFHFYSKHGRYPTSWTNKTRPTTADFEKILPFIKK